jgi:hypothetical protein
MPRIHVTPEEHLTIIQGRMVKMKEEAYQDGWNNALKSAADLFFDTMSDHDVMDREKIGDTLRKMMERPS